MPNCFRLWRDGKPVPLNKIDEELCAAFGEPVHETRYFRSWFDIIGFGIAMGNALGSAELREAVPAHQHDVLDWLEKNFTSDAWYELKKR